MDDFEVDVIIPVHSATRPIARAVRSVVENGVSRARAIVVAHNIDPEIIRGNLRELDTLPEVLLAALNDGIPSPSGPLNHGLDLASAPYFALLGSDDELAPGALDSWLRISRQTGATTVLARIDRELSGVDRLPPTRLGRTRELDAVKDRLTYRCTPLGLVSRDAFPDLRFTPGLHSGEDLEFTAELWFRGRHIAYDREGPAYIGHEDEPDRVTQVSRTVEQDFAFLDAIEASAWYGRTSRAQRTALAIKIIRLHYFDAVLSRLDAPEGFEAHRSALDALLTRLQRMSPLALSLVSRADHHAIRVIRDSESTPTAVRAALEGRWTGGPIGMKVPRNPLLALHRQAPYATLRAMVVPAPAASGR